MIETALVMPVLVLMLCFAIDIGYFFIVAANLVSSSRNAVLYSGQGFVSPGATAIAIRGNCGIAERYRRRRRAGGRRSLRAGQYDHQDEGPGLLQEDRDHPDLQRLRHELQHVSLWARLVSPPTRTRSRTMEC